jgi:transcriptional regulator with XRE-family HTH domain
MSSKKSAANQALRAIRLERGLNQEAFVAHAGLDRSDYGAIERGEFNVTLDTIVKLAARSWPERRRVVGSGTR